MNEWLPDWKDPANYPAYDAPMAEWAWEFLRRNPLYQADYKKLVSDLEKTGGNARLPPMVHSRQSEEERLNTQLSNDRWHKLNAAFTSKYGVKVSWNRAPNPTLPYKKEYPSFTHRPHLTFHNFFSRLAPKFRNKLFHKYYPTTFKNLEDEHRPEGYWLNTGLNKAACIANNEITNDVPIKVTARTLVVEISLESPLSEQLQTVKEVATFQQKQLMEWGLIKKGRKEPTHYAGYLRLLDALAGGEERQTIADILFPRLTNDHPSFHANKERSNWKKAARKIVYSDYLKIASLQQPTSP